MNNKDLTSLMEAYDNVASPNGEHATSDELSAIASPTVQTTSEGDGTKEFSNMIETNSKVAIDKLKEIESSINRGKQLEPWMEERLTKAKKNFVVAVQYLADIASSLH
jgi:hypothetical protein